ncbi:MAG: AAA-like domain-containing protein, partial [Cyanobacteria bacterium J06649_4]
MSDYRYHVGGSLSPQAPSYIERSADKALYAALQAGEFCYVLNSRQMGKSSLMVKVSHQLQTQGYRCVVLDMTRVGSENISPGQWYKGIATELWDGFDLVGKVDLKAWWRELETISMSQRLGRFIDSLLFTH